MEAPVNSSPKIRSAMSLRDIGLHLRVPFSFFLLPVFWFALSQSAHPDVGRTWAVVLIIHLLLYPASHAYNSYYDKDEDSIGMLASPPPVDRTLWWVALGLDALALLLGIGVGWPFVGYLLVYGLISRAYSYDRIRLKKYPVLSWLIVGSCQGGLTYLATYQAINQVPVAELLQPSLLLAATLCSLNILAVYPITQVYQHAEDGRRGDLTMSRLLGIRGTFWCTAILFALTMIGFYIFFRGQAPFYGLQLCLLPATVYFVRWYSRVHRNPNAADYRSAMRMTLLAGIGLNLFFIILWGLN
ncbi:UbiA family prenyltransferase [Spirosoma spitsbergense]|uniref:UbiA family prenyltransferase n=1 Tax=Spirosoma spitsbergense TaxID=431554 RepID=UPI0003665F59|nr:UbiA family prenyltransferase [Spirosoma spitsbergense]